MDLKKELAELTAMIDKPSKDVNKLLVEAKILTIVNELQNSKTLSAEVFESLDSETRRLALILILSAIMETVNE